LDGSADAGATDTGTADASRINVNTATVEELQRLPGVGEATAASIVDDREQNGPFSSAEDLMRVSGIGEKKFDKMRGMIDV
jgi:competence protein ComEA